MNRVRLLALLVVIAGASSAWWGRLRADDESATAPSQSQIVELLKRVEKLEHRVEVLERGVIPAITDNRVETTSSEKGRGASASTERQPPEVGIIYRLKRFTPEKPQEPPRTAFQSGGVTITR